MDGADYSNEYRDDSGMRWHVWYENLVTIGKGYRFSQVKPHALTDAALYFGRLSDSLLAVPQSPCRAFG